MAGKRVRGEKAPTVSESHEANSKAFPDRRPGDHDLSDLHTHTY